MAHLSPAERVARGKAARNDTPRSSHGRWEPATNRPDPVALLEEQAVSRVPELVPLRYGRMMVSPFTFYRGGALIMASDLAATPRSGLNAQICGDAHLSNFGVFASPERQMMFDINDFDETLPGPWEWDVKRLAASFEIAGRDRGFKPADRRAVVMAGVAEYRIRMHEFAAARNLDVWYAHIPVDRIFKELEATATKKQQAKAKANAAKARTRDSMQAFTKLTHVVDGQRRIISDPPLIVPIEELIPPGSGRDDIESELRELIRSYRRTLETDRRELLESLRVRPLRPQGGRCRQRRHPRLDRADARPRRPGPAVPAGQGGPGVGAGTVRRQEQVPQPRPARRRRPTPDAGIQRHLPGLAAGHRARREGARLLPAPAARLEGLGRRRHHGRRA